MLCDDLCIFVPFFLSFWSGRGGNFLVPSPFKTCQTTDLWIRPGWRTPWPTGVNWGRGKHLFRGTREDARHHCHDERWRNRIIKSFNFQVESFLALDSFFIKSEPPGFYWTYQVATLEVFCPLGPLDVEQCRTLETVKHSRFWSVSEFPF